MIEMLTGLRINNAYIRPGGVAAGHAPRAVEAKLRDLVRYLRKMLVGVHDLLEGNGVFMARCVDVGYLDLTGCVALGVTGPILRIGGPALGPAQVAAVLRLREVRLRRPDRRHL